MEKSMCGLCKQEVPFGEWEAHVKTQEHQKKEHEFFNSQDSLEFVAFNYTESKSFLEALNILLGLEKYAVSLRQTR
jgi:hypothetical protein